MPAQIPLSWISVDESFTITMSTPGSIPSLRTPMMLPLKPVGLVPWMTVRPVTLWPSVRSSTGYAVSQEPGTAWEAVASPAVPVRHRPAVTAAETASRARAVDRDMGGGPSVGRLPRGRRSWSHGRASPTFSCLRGPRSTRADILWVRDGAGATDRPDLASAGRGVLSRPRPPARGSGRRGGAARDPVGVARRGGAARLGHDAHARARLRARGRLGVPRRNGRAVVAAGGGVLHRRRPHRRAGVQRGDGARLRAGRPRPPSRRPVRRLLGLRR